METAEDKLTAWAFYQSNGFSPINVTWKVTSETPESMEKAVCWFYHWVCIWFKRISSFRAHFVKQNTECWGMCYHSCCTQQICYVFSTFNTEAVFCYKGYKFPK